MAICLGLQGQAGARRHIHLLTPILIVNHILQSIASSTFNLRA